MTYSLINGGQWCLKTVTRSILQHCTDNSPIYASTYAMNEEKYMQHLNSLKSKAGTGKTVEIRWERASSWQFKSAKYINKKAKIAITNVPQSEKATWYDSYSLML